MKATAILAIGAVAGVAYLMFRSHRQKQEIIKEARRPKHIPGPARDVYSGDYISPYKPRFPYNVATTKPHKDIYTGRLVSNHDPYPSQPSDKAENYIINKMIHEFTAEGRLDNETASQLNSRIKSDYMTEIAHIAKMNHYKLKPLTGPALSEYSQLMLTIASSHGLYLSSSARARYEAQTFVKPYVHQHSVHRIDIAAEDDE